MSKKRSKSDSKVIPLRVPQPLAKRIRECSDKANLSDADVMRMSIERGLESVVKMFAA